MKMKSEITQLDLKQLPTSINKRISLLSSDEQTFQETDPLYQKALRHSNFNHTLGYMKQTLQQPRRNRQRSKPFSSLLSVRVSKPS